jgi:hypothetical protein
MHFLWTLQSHGLLLCTWHWLSVGRMVRWDECYSGDQSAGTNACSGGLSRRTPLLLFPEYIDMLKR